MTELVGGRPRDPREGGAFGARPGPGSARKRAASTLPLPREVLRQTSGVVESESGCARFADRYDLVMDSGGHRLGPLENAGWRVAQGSDVARRGTHGRPLSP